MNRRNLVILLALTVVGTVVVLARNGSSTATSDQSQPRIRLSRVMPPLR